MSENEPLKCQSECCSPPCRCSSCEEIGTLRKEIESKDALLREQAEVIEIYREALEYYSDHADYKGEFNQVDGGQEAMQALRSARKVMR